MSTFSAIRDVLAFLTVIPVGSPGGIGGAARGAWLFPAAGALLGIPAALAGYVLMQFLSPDVSLLLALFILYVLTGFHHLDGLLDTGDALMCRGSRERRREVMHDLNTGAGGYGAGFFVLLLTFLALREAPRPLLALVVAETAAKMSMVSALYIGRPSHEGMGSRFSAEVRRNHLMFFSALVLAVSISFFFLGVLGLQAVLAALVAALGMDVLARRSLGGISGDVLGAVNEVSRVGALVVMLL
ncbi:MAG: adenosylcobinamide-GDP ribazoletransferase [Euryarchaeota archaeon]|nr:adenosylcobinamide-GDP ribazoletransferase [Euryarchaeota archaeon]